MRSSLRKNISTHICVLELFYFISSCTVSPASCFWFKLYLEIWLYFFNLCTFLFVFFFTKKMVDYMLIFESKPNQMYIWSKFLICYHQVVQTRWYLFLSNRNLKFKFFTISMIETFNYWENLAGCQWRRFYKGIHLQYL